MTGSRSPVEFVPYNQVFDDSFEDMPRRVPDIGKIGRFIGYRPTVHLDEIIEHVVDFWMAAHGSQPTPLPEAPERLQPATRPAAAVVF